MLGQIGLLVLPNELSTHLIDTMVSIFEPSAHTLDRSGAGHVLSKFGSTSKAVLKNLEKSLIVTFISQ
jgi:hypothetical protein